MTLLVTSWWCGGYNTDTSKCKLVFLYSMSVQFAGPGELLVLDINYHVACEFSSQSPLLVHVFVVCNLRQSLSVDREVS